MEGTFKPPKSIVFDQNIHKNFENFLRSFEIYLRATGFASKDDETKIAIMLNIAGEEAQRKFLTFQLTAAQRKDYNAVIQSFKNYCKPMKNETFDRYKFFTRVQQEGESFDHFLTEVKMLASECNFGDLEESLLRDKIVSGILDLSIQERLLQQSNLTLKKAEEFCRATEISRIQVKELKTEKEVDAIQHQRVTHQSRRANEKNNNTQVDVNKNNKYDCLKCGRNHARMNCPAFGKTCNICSKPNHFAVGCLLKNSKRSTNNAGQHNNKKYDRKRVVHEVENESVNGDDTIFVDNINVVHDFNVKESNNVWLINTIINNKHVNLKLDTGASCNCMPIKMYNELGLDSNKIIKDSVSIIAYGNNRLETLGYAVIKCNVKGAWYNIKFLLINESSVPVLGLNACVKLQLIKKVEEINQECIDKKTFINKNKDVFEGTGKVPLQYKIVLKQNATPFVSSCRRIPDTVKPKLKCALDDLIKRDIICKIEEPTEWVNNIVIVEKANNKIRICLDPIHLNKNICLDQFPIPTVDELAVKLKNKSVFTVLDLKEGFYHVPLAKESVKLTCFITPFGKYAFKRLPFGLNVSPEVFQRANEKIFGDLNIGIYFDDFIIAGSNEQEHDKILDEVMSRARKFGVKFNINKVQYKVKEVKYIGQTFSSEGVRPDPQYIQAIQELENPKNKKDLLRILGMLNYLTKYIPNLSNLLHPLRNLTKNNVVWQWTVDHTETLNNIKNIITKIPNLQIFDSKCKIELQTDASLTGIGGCLLQNGKPVAFCSRSLTEAEVRYPQIDKELLSICFAFKKFHNFVYGRKVLVKTDHRPLVSICNKEFYKISNRIQRLKLKLLKYNFDIEYLPGKYMYIADLLSRNYIKINDNKPMTATVVHCLSTTVPMSDERQKELQNAIKTDQVMSQILKFCEEGWPEKKLTNLTDKEMSIFFKLQQSLHSENGMIFLNDKLVIPKILRNQILNKLHTAHLGIEKTKARARKILYWPGLSQDIQNFISKCKACLKYSKNNIKEPLIPHDRPDIPFYKVATDIFSYGGSEFLVVVDYFSNWIEMCELANKTVSEVIIHLKRIFSTFGIPKIVISDNNPYNSLEFKNFAKQWEFSLITSSPRYPKSNGLAERAVGICKNMLRKCAETNTDIFKGLLEYRTTPLSGHEVSPSELLNHRLLRTCLPVSLNILNKETNVNIKGIKEKRAKAQKYYNRSAKQRDSFNAGDSVIIQKEHSRHWIPGEIVRKCDTPRSYLIRDSYGKILRRNSSFIRHSPNPIMPPQSEILIDVDPSPLIEQNDVKNIVSNESNNQNQNLKKPEITVNSPIKTRSGRIVNKPYRYRF